MQASVAHALTDLFCSSSFLSSSSSATETSFGSELLLLSGTAERPPTLSPPDLELAKDDMDADGDWRGF